LDAVQPNAVINAAAYNMVDLAEDEPELAHTVNALGPRALAKYCAARDIPLLHVSSDYVFGLDDNRKTPYREDDATGPLSVYGTSKLAGEFFVRSVCPRHFVVRTCGLYGRNAPHGNFVETMLRLAGQGKKLRVVDDQRCTPTSTLHLAGAIRDLLSTTSYGIYHATNSGDATWYQFAAEIFRQMKLDVDLTPITTAEYGARAKRPAYSVLDCSRLRSAIGYELPMWKDAFKAYLASRPS
jgi:dTDP-4-dehydrorhamnose reductase